MINLYDNDSLVQFLTKTHQRAFFTKASQELPINTHQAGNYRWYRVFKLTPTSDDLPNFAQTPKVIVCVGLSDHIFLKNRLEVSYFIEKTPLIDLTVENHHYNQADFLWQENCLEFFIEYNGTTDYFEINVALDNRYNAYHFDDYRMPDIMPPRQASPDDILIASNNIYDIADGFYSRHIYLASNNGMLPTRLNPTVILYPNGKQPIFYAVKHANPPDFHNKQCWQFVSQN